MINGCDICLEKQRKIDRLEREVVALKVKLRRQQTKGLFAENTPSSKIPFKANVPVALLRRGAQRGHKGCARPSVSSAMLDSQVIELAPEHVTCPDCGGRLRTTHMRDRVVCDADAVSTRHVAYRLPTTRCDRCKVSRPTRAPGVQPKMLFSNQLLATTATMHFVHCVPLARVCEQYAVNQGALVGAYHRLAAMFENVPRELTALYRQAPVKHADETGWRTAGQSGFMWLFTTPQISIFRIERSRASAIVDDVLGKDALPGVLVVDRYGGYNRAPCAIQYCFAHLLRTIRTLTDDFPSSDDVARFCSRVIPLLAEAMGLRNQKLSKAKFLARGRQLHRAIMAAMAMPARHGSVLAMQSIFTRHHDRLFHWSRDPCVPAENNRAERELRPSVVARKVSFGSQSERGAKTRSTLMTILHTIAKADCSPAAQFKSALDDIVKSPTREPFELLLPNLAQR